MGIWVVLPPCPLSPARESAEENAQRRGSEIAVMMYSRGHAASGRPTPGHTIDATDRRVSELIERSGAEI
jgi:hypothetical protein